MLEIESDKESTAASANTANFEYQPILEGDAADKLPQKRQRKLPQKFQDYVLDTSVQTLNSIFNDFPESDTLNSTDKKTNQLQWKQMTIL